MGAFRVLIYRAFPLGTSLTLLFPHRGVGRSCLGCLPVTVQEVNLPRRS